MKSRLLQKAIVKCLALFLAVVLFSCSKEKNEDLCSDPTLMRELRMGDIAAQGITYNANCQVSELLEPYKYSRFSYNAAGQLVKVEEAVSANPLSCVAFPGGDDGSFGDPRKAKVTAYFDYEYSANGKIAKRTRYNTYGETPQLAYYQIFHYTNNVVDSIKLYTQTGKLTSFDTYLYENGNLKSEKHFVVQGESETRLFYQVEFEFDNKNNPFNVLNVNGMPGISTNKNNIVKETRITNPGPTESRYTVVTSYEYNTSGNPVKINNQTVVYGG